MCVVDLGIVKLETTLAVTSDLDLSDARAPAAGAVTLRQLAVPIRECPTARQITYLTAPDSLTARAQGGAVVGATEILVRV